jgi:hypothetical protein
MSDCNDNSQLGQLQRVLSKIDNPELCETIIDSISCIDPNFFLIAEISNEKFLDFQIKFVNVLPQDLFNRFMALHRKNLPTKTLESLSAEKLSIWYTTRGNEVLCDEVGLIRILVSKNLIPENTWDYLVNGYLKGNCGSATSTAAHYELVEILLMTYGDKIDIIPENITDIKISRMVMRYLLNKNKMLKLECDTKEQFIASVETNKS